MAPNSSNPLHENLLNNKDGDKGEPVFNRAGLTSEQAEDLIKSVGYNELPVVEISLLYVLLRQFMGTMPYMLEFASLISIIVQDYIDFGIILTMLLCNGFLGFYEELKAAASLVGLLCIKIYVHNIYLNHYFPLF